MDEISPPLPVQTIEYAPYQQTSQAVRVLTIVLLAWASMVTLRHLLYWGNTLQQGVSFPSILMLALALMEIAGYVVIAIGASGGLAGRLPSRGLLITGAFIASGAIVLNVLLTIATGMSAPTAMNNYLWYAWRIVFVLGPVVVPFTCGILLLRLKP